MSTGKLKREIEKAVEAIGCFAGFSIVDETENTLKCRLPIDRLCYVQLYFNLKKNLKNYVVVLNGHRVYGVDCDGGKWHRHPWKNPGQHEKAREVSLNDFLFEVYEGLWKLGIL